METGIEFFYTLANIDSKKALANYIFEKLEIQDNPKKYQLFNLAYEYGHSARNEEIYNYAVDFVDLID